MKKFAKIAVLLSLAIAIAFSLAFAIYHQGTRPGDTANVPRVEASSVATSNGTANVSRWLDPNTICIDAGTWQIQVVGENIQGVAWYATETEIVIVITGAIPSDDGENVSTHDPLPRDQEV